ncbi:polysaccharide biosynthesis/export family protein [Hephaestia sp. GCM10023244]|uniref:polysaccharide biosynthesis/export family protein n=1 Tax=unclassified Hephaestia TaxID=2631281 RepID=UPI002077167A|nr:polysaccharide biosynthesis/export family protein [Hephaestia sp. MAHUQ-44]MCM8732561.1 polysaccharide export protein [Hephaestia sp. MAHUQ-44]
MVLRRVAIASVLTVLCAGCNGMRAGETLPRGGAAYGVIPAPDAGASVAAYRIGALDVLKVTVFQEEDLSFDTLSVDASGNVSLPLIGTVRAEGATAAELSDEIAAKLGAKYLVNPQVSVTVASSVSQNVTVEGNVGQPGVYAINGRSTLLQALAQAQSPTDVAKLDQVVIFRNIEGRRAGAVFDVKAIREGRAADPEILGGDVIVVGFDALKGVFRDFLKMGPLLYAFQYF